MFKMQIALTLFNLILWIPEGFSASQSFPLFDYALCSGRTGKNPPTTTKKSNIRSGLYFSCNPSQPLFLRYFWARTSTVSKLWTGDFKYFSLGPNSHKLP